MTRSKSIRGDEGCQFSAGGLALLYLVMELLLEMSSDLTSKWRSSEDSKWLGTFTGASVPSLQLTHLFHHLGKLLQPKMDLHHLLESLEPPFSFLAKLFLKLEHLSTMD
jgi:hypothetical protein